LDEDTKNTWYHHWVRSGLEAFEKQLHQAETGIFCHGDQVSMADCVLVPQIFNAKRFKVDLNGLARTMQIFDACMALPAFSQAQPSACPDFEA
jgi:maleylacetoacetate isomerase/maleylpyruvate isomerase